MSDIVFHDAERVSALIIEARRMVKEVNACADLCLSLGAKYEDQDDRRAFNTSRRYLSQPSNVLRFPIERARRVR